MAPDKAELDRAALMCPHCKLARQFRPPEGCRANRLGISLAAIGQSQAGIAVWGVAPDPENVFFWPLEAFGITASVRHACAIGLQIEFLRLPGLDHDALMEKSTPDLLAWARNRLDGKPWAGNCGAPGMP